MINPLTRLALLSLLAALGACGDTAWNNPNPPAEEGVSTYYSMMTLVPPKHLDPATSYASDEGLFIDQIYQPPLAYHFLKRPYELIPLGVEALPEVEFLNRAFEVVPEGSDKIIYSRYYLTVAKDRLFQPHPSFAKDEQGEPLYLFETAEQSVQYRSIPDFPETDSRTLTADDYIYGIKRLADPRNKSPMLGMMGQYIVGLRQFTYVLTDMEDRPVWTDLRDFDVQGLEKIDERRFAITIHGQYPQFVYWMAMHFLSPVPVEADRFYHNPGFKEKNMTLDWWPVGTGAYMMVKNDPNSEIVLERNPNFTPEYFPTEGAPGDLEAGFLEDAGKQIPFIDRAHYHLEKEVLPLWTKFRQGYFDRSGEVQANTARFFDQAFKIGADGLELSEEMQSHNLTVTTDVKPSLYYWGFNMRDPVVGGYSEEKRKLRQALSIAYNMEEYITIFESGNAIAAQGPVPPGIPGAIDGEPGMNPYIYDWVDGKPQRKSIEYAQQLMVEAGYPNGRDAQTGEPLRIYIDIQSSEAKNAQMNWTVRQMQRLGVQVEFRPADWNRTREKLMTGNTQIYSHGWIADYPDPENFLFLLYGPESPLVCSCDGANNSSYENPEFDELFKRMRVLQPGAERDEVLAQMVDFWRRDAVWLRAFHPLEFYLNNEWVYNTKKPGIGKRNLKYVRLDSELRAQRQAEWNAPVIWPLVAFVLGVIGLLVPGGLAYRRRQRERIRG